MPIRTRFITLICLTLSSYPIQAADESPGAGTAIKEQTSPNSDNTKQNKVHDGSKAVTAEQQGSSKQDIELTRKIRRAIVDDSSLSTYAHNVKIISNNGHVVLKGPVRSAQEKEIIEGKAVSLAGKDMVHSEIEISAK